MRTAHRRINVAGLGARRTRVAGDPGYPDTWRRRRQGRQTIDHGNVVGTGSADDKGNVAMLRNVIRTLVTVLWVLILILVGGRFIALLVNANRESEIVRELLRRSDFWVKPFFCLFGLTSRAVQQTGGLFEPASLIAFVVYLVIGLLVIQLLTASFFVMGRRWTFLRRPW